MLGFWEVVLVLGILGIVSEFVLRIVKMGTKYHENVKRIERGYPTLDGAVSYKAEFNNSADESEGTVYNQN